MTQPIDSQEPASARVRGESADALDVTPAALVFLRWSLVGLSLVMVLLFLVTARLRMSYPYSYNENGMLESVRHISAGLPLYAAPSTAFTPYLYTPIFYYASALVAKFTGLNFVALRTVSLLSTLGCLGVLYALVFAEVRRHYAAIAAVGCFVGCYPLILQWFDVGRVDMLYLFFLLCALFASRRMHPLVAALLWVCAFQTKQGVLPVAVLALAHDWQRPRRVVMGLGAFFAGLAASIAWLAHESGGWYMTYVFRLAGGFGYNVREAARYIPTDLLSVYGVALLIAVAALLLAPPRWRNPATSFYALGCVSMVLFTGYIRGHRGSGPNTLLPAYVWISALFGIALARLVARLEAMDGAASRAAMAVLLLAGCVQVAMHAYLPQKFVPNAQELAERKAFEEQISIIPGNVMVVAFPEYAVLAGKQSFADMDAIGAVIEANNHQYGDDLLRQYAELIHSGSLSAVVTERPAEAFLAMPRVWMPKDFLAYYPLVVAASSSPASLVEYQPHFIYLPCSQAAAARRLNPQIDLGPCARPQP